MKNVFAGLQNKLTPFLNKCNINICIYDKNNIPFYSFNNFSSSRFMTSSPKKIIKPLPPKPIMPLDEDCCGSGCNFCVFDIYEQELKLWEKECAKVEKENKEGVNINDDNLQEIVGLNTNSYSKFQLIKIAQLTSNTKLYTFDLGAIPNQSKLEPGQHLILRDQQQSISRQYSPVSFDQNHFKVLIKTYKYGKMSRYVNTWSVGDNIEWRGPFGNFQYRPNSYKHLYMLAAGTGMAPMLPIIKSVLENESDETILHSFFCFKNYDDILMKSKLDEYQDFWNFKLRYFISQQIDNKNINYKDVKIIVNSRLTFELLNDKTKDLLHNSFFLICGTTSFINDTQNYVKKLNVPTNNCYVF